tara:strand:- start:49 stop:1827 length:1779 start_codon:yes stop_codon:yes gene_type:complete
MTLTQIKPAGLSKPISLADDEKIQLGGSNDFEIFHQSSNGNSIIKESGGGILSLQTNGANISLYDFANNVTMANFVTGGSCIFKHGATTRLQTTSTGIMVDPVVTIDGSTPRLQMKPTADSQSHRIEFYNTADSQVARIFGDPSTGNLSLQTGTNGIEEAVKCISNGAVQLHHDNSKEFETTSYGAEFFGDAGIARTAGGYTFREVAGGSERAGIHSDASNDLIFKAGGASEAARFDASTLRFGIGTTQPASNLHIHGSTPSIRLSDSDNSSAYSMFDANGANLNIHADKGNTVANTTIGFGVDNSIKMTLDSSGRLLIGTTTEGHAAADNLTVADTGNSGITIRSGTSNNGALYFSDGTSGSDEYKGAVRYSHSDNALGFYANGSERLRLSSGGRLELRNTSGNIRMSFENSGGLNFITSNSGEEIKVSSGNGDANGIEFWDYTGVNKRCQIDGHGIKFNSDTAAANALDDYEEGTFTPTSNNSLGDAVGSYTKIGRQVTLHIRVQVDSNTNTNFMVIGGFPFNASMPSGLSNGSTPSGFGYISGSVINGGIQIHTRYDTNSTNFYNFGGSLRRSHFSGRELRFGLVYFTA